MSSEDTKSGNMRLGTRIAIFVLLLACAGGAAFGEVFYVDRTSGRDSASGTSPETAWSSLARISSASLREGDYVLLKRGEVWRETLTLSARGLVEAPITIGAYGPAEERPVIEGYQRIAGSSVDLLSLDRCRNLVIEHLEIRKSSRNGINAFRCDGLTLRDLVVSRSQWNGILAFNSSHILIEDCDIYGNALDLSTNYDGIRVDGSQQVQSVLIRNNTVHGNIGGEGWQTANGIYIGHTGAPVPTLTGVEITANDIYANGNPDQNQAGRGLTGTFHGEIAVTSNYIHDNASAGLYLGDRGNVLSIQILNNTFYNNALRQFGGFTDTVAVAAGNVVFVDDRDETAMGVEIGGQGVWRIERNAFFYMTTTADTFRGYVRLNDEAQDRNLIADRNLYYSPTALPFRKSDGTPLTFSAWQAAGFDRNSQHPGGAGAR